ncbi:P-loop containing nucleoside triphosphate hydrolase protein [Sistotremastrum niveocremeum HHB9708]|uniref:DNA 3'-5' helicase n=1 Tax=Sistotremastrum niveocremeum HHB9708 TaxID=1314777 RepID=A0A164Y150_9AGAM|nr:P-loop containing nucleoside triphosphate hydrolase protein [Sistotremastrum niveocremeum HHB9708]
MPPKFQDPNAALEKARQKASKESNYSSSQTRTQMSELISNNTKASGVEEIKPCQWQLSVAEATVLGLDVSVMIKCGAGKTLTFAMPLLLHEARNPGSDKIVVVVTPFVLGVDKCALLKSYGVRPVAIWEEGSYDEATSAIASGEANVLLVSPEWIAEDDDFREWLAYPEIGPRVLYVVIDDAHMLTSSGPAFDESHTRLGEIRTTILSHSFPILATSAILTLDMVKEVHEVMHMTELTAVHFHLGNDRANIYLSVMKMKTEDIDYGLILGLLFKAPIKSNKTRGALKREFKKSVAFFDEVWEAEEMKEFIDEHHPELSSRVECFHWQRDPDESKRMMEEFKQGKIDVLLSAEGAATGCDVDDIELSLQVGMPSTIGEYTLRMGTAGRNMTMQAVSVMLVEKSYG